MEDSAQESRIARNGQAYTYGEFKEYYGEDADEEWRASGDGEYSAYFASTRMHQDFWPLMIEKAWAKIHGSYARIGWGHAWEAYRAVTGNVNGIAFFFNGKRKKILNADEAFDVLQRYMEEAPMVANAPDHAYTVLDVDTTAKRVKLHNPLAIDDDDEAGWDALHVDEARGIFWLGITRFHQEFHSLQVLGDTSGEPPPKGYKFEPDKYLSTWRSDDADAKIDLDPERLNGLNNFDQIASNIGQDSQFPEESVIPEIRQREITWIAAEKLAHIDKS